MSTVCIGTLLLLEDKMSLSDSENALSNICTLNAAVLRDTMSGKVSGKSSRVWTRRESAFQSVKKPKHSSMLVNLHQMAEGDGWHEQPGPCSCPSACQWEVPAFPPIDSAFPSLPATRPCWALSWSSLLPSLVVLGNRWLPLHSSWDETLLMESTVRRGWCTVWPSLWSCRASRSISTSASTFQFLRQKRCHGNVETLEPSRRAARGAEFEVHGFAGIDRKFWDLYIMLYCTGSMSLLDMGIFLRRRKDFASYVLDFRLSSSDSGDAPDQTELRSSMVTMETNTNIYTCTYRLNQGNSEVLHVTSDHACFLFPSLFKVQYLTIFTLPSSIFFLLPVLGIPNSRTVTHAFPCMTSGHSSGLQFRSLPVTFPNFSHLKEKKASCSCVSQAEKIQKTGPVDELIWVQFWSFWLFCIMVQTKGHRQSRKASYVKLHKKIQRKSWSNMPLKLLSCIGFWQCTQNWPSPKVQSRSGSPLDLSFWSFLTFLHHDGRSREASSVKILLKKFKGKVGQMCHGSCSLA